MFGTFSQPFLASRVEPPDEAVERGDRSPFRPAVLHDGGGG